MQAALTQYRLPCRSRHQLRSPWRWTMRLPMPWQRPQGRRTLLQRGPPPPQVGAPPPVADSAAKRGIAADGACLTPVCAPLHPCTAEATGQADAAAKGDCLLCAPLHTCLQMLWESSLRRWMMLQRESLGVWRMLQCVGFLLSSTRGQQTCCRACIALPTSCCVGVRDNRYLCNSCLQ